MSAPQKLDNSTATEKIQLRLRALQKLGDVEPVVMETHGGFGRIWTRAYQGIEAGIVFEENPDKATALAQQRSTWAVYEADCIRALRAGVGSHLCVNFLDLDPWGDPWPVLDAFLESDRPRASRLILVVNDGMRLMLSMNGAWHVASLKDAVLRHGNAVIFKNYLRICQEMVTAKAEKAGYRLLEWAGYYCGQGKHMTHFAAVLEQ